jgi:hypothetical protein
MSNALSLKSYHWLRLVVSTVVVRRFHAGIRLGTMGLTREGPGSAGSIHHPYFPTIHDQYCRRNMDDGCCQLFESRKIRALSHKYVAGLRRTIEQLQRTIEQLRRLKKPLSHDSRARLYSLHSLRIRSRGGIIARFCTYENAPSLQGAVERPLGHTFQ